MSSHRKSTGLETRVRSGYSAAKSKPRSRVRRTTRRKKKPSMFLKYFKTKTPKQITAEALAREKRKGKVERTRAEASEKGKLKVIKAREQARAEKKQRKRERVRAGVRAELTGAKTVRRLGTGGVVAGKGVAKVAKYFERS